MPTRFCSTRPPHFDCINLCDLYRQFEAMFLPQGGFSEVLLSSCGMSITVMDRHFMHLAGVKRIDDPKRKLDIQVERPQFLGAISGHGPYTIDVSRASRLACCLDTMTDPDAVIKWATPQTATLGFFKHYDVEGRSPIYQ